MTGTSGRTLSTARPSENPLELFLRQTAPGPMTLGQTPRGEPMIFAPGSTGGTTTLRFGRDGARIDISPGGGVHPETVHFPK